ncbi:MAG: ribose-phosphate pyrophosphokinase [Rickettsiales bacterium]|jgi:ribose-phosphate pyrophosphokinase
MKILSGNSNKFLAEKISENLKLSLLKANITRFADNEVYVEIKENVRGEDIFIIQSTSCPANDNIMELLITIDALKRASAKRITAVIPYFGYARQDRKSLPRTPISAKLVADIITKAGADRVLTIDLHATQIQGFFDIPVDNLFAAPLFAADIKKKFKDRDPLIISPDVGGLVRARAIAKKIDAELGIIDKRRPKAGISQVMNIIGEVEGKDCIIIDDIVDSGGTLCNAGEALIKAGANSVSAYITHGILSGEAIEKIKNSHFETLVITDSIDQHKNINLTNKIKILSIANLFAAAINNTAFEKSVSTLFD